MAAWQEAIDDQCHSNLLGRVVVLSFKILLECINIYTLD